MTCPAAFHPAVLVQAARRAGGSVERSKEAELSGCHAAGEHAKLWGAGVIELVPRRWNGSELMT